MLSDFVNTLKALTEEERKILGGGIAIQKNLYTSSDEFIIDSKKLLERGRLIDIRKHTRFTYFPVHRHNYVEMVFMLSGSLTTTIDRTKSLTLKDGDLLILNQHEILPCGMNDIAVNFLILPEFFSRPIIALDRDNILRTFFLSILTPGNHSEDYLFFHTRGVIPVENLIENLLWSLLVRGHGMNVINQTTMNLLFINLSYLSSDLRSHEEQEFSDAVLSVLEYIDKNYISGTLEEAAKCSGYSSAYLSRLLKKRTGKTFKQMLQERKLQQCIYYLENTSLSAAQIMSRIGYENSCYFYQVFRERCGCSPREYRKQHFSASG